MKGEKHTPGPWAVHPRFRDLVVVAADTTKGIGGNADPEVEAERYAKIVHRTGEPSKHPEFHRSRITSRDELDANARLIAAAPELLAAARDAVAFLDTVEWNDATSEHDGVNVQHALEAAIAKASGEAQILDPPEAGVPEQRKEKP